MHPSSYAEMKKLVARFPRPPKSVLDVGSYDMGGTYRGLFGPATFYQGLDLKAGPNVDVVASEPYRWPVAAGRFELVISGQCLEHVSEPKRWMAEVARACACCGHVIVIAPWSWGEHCRPDYWRILPDGMRHLMEHAGLDVIDVYINETDTAGFAAKDRE